MLCHNFRDRTLPVEAKWVIAQYSFCSLQSSPNDCGRGKSVALINGLFSSKPHQILFKLIFLSGPKDILGAHRKFRKCCGPELILHKIHILQLFRCLPDYTNIHLEQIGSTHSLSSSSKVPAAIAKTS